MFNTLAWKFLLFLLDDILITSSNAKIIDEFKEDKMQGLEMTNNGLMTCFLGMEINQEEKPSFNMPKKIKFLKNSKTRIVKNLIPNKSKGKVVQNGTNEMNDILGV